MVALLTLDMSSSPAEQTVGETFKVQGLVVVVVA